MLTQTEKYLYKKYHKSYNEIFEKEKANFAIMPKIKIEHIESTAVKGLGGKGIVDIMIGTKKIKMGEVSKAIVKKGYKLINKETNRWFFEKDVCYPFVKRIHIQLIPLKSKMWKNTLMFRDHLIKNKKARLRYSKIKRAASKLAKGDGFSYRKHKSLFINKILNKVNTRK